MIITLSNGKRVANFSSPHPFLFTDGSILPAVDDEQSEYLKVTFTEEIVNDKGDVQLNFSLSEQVKERMRYWKWQMDGRMVDVVFVPLPMLVAISTEYGEQYLLDSPFRGIRIGDRIKKLVSIDKQCLAKGQC